MTFTRIHNRDLWIPFLSEVLKLVLKLREAGSLDDFVSFGGPVPKFQKSPVTGKFHNLAFCSRCKNNSRI